MRTALLVSVVLFLLVEAQGIRVQQHEFTSASHQKFHVGVVMQEEKKSSLRKESGGVGAVLCKDGHCSGRSTKLMTQIIFTSSTSTSSKNVKNSEGTKIKPTLKHHIGSYEGFVGNEEKFLAKSLPVSENGNVAPESYPDIIDMAEMDYSPARKKSPIHN
ncbi:hypothetical protein NE237_027648 [Protea cynaroides]|uniref:Uncharacterized protein n=1 Tax=Protea cynaroides TaxID=273540 RepID=A0A9Q0GPQ5_9MAGN|nr:hypothetical protein NE237_027648 [Protea cynaroides]